MRWDLKTRSIILEMRDRFETGLFLFIQSGFLKQWRDDGFLESSMAHPVV